MSPRQPARDEAAAFRCEMDLRGSCQGASNLRYSLPGLPRDPDASAPRGQLCPVQDLCVGVSAFLVCDHFGVVRCHYATRTLRCDALSRVHYSNLRDHVRRFPFLDKLYCTVVIAGQSLRSAQ